MAHRDNLRLDHQLCFALYAATNAVTRAYRAPLGKLGLTYPQYLVMLALWEHNKLTVKGLADLLQLDSSTITPLLKRLEAGGILTRQRDSHDQRIVRITLTALGKSLRQPVASVQTGVQCRTELATAEFIELRERLHALVATLAETSNEEKLSR